MEEHALLAHKPLVDSLSANQWQVVVALLSLVYRLVCLCDYSVASFFLDPFYKILTLVYCTELISC